MNGNNDISPLRTGLTVAVTVIGVFVLYKIGQKLNLLPHFGEEILERQTALTPELYQKRPNAVTITSQVALQLANTIYYAKGYVWDSEEKAIGAVQAANTKVNLSFVAYVFENQYSTALAPYLQSFLEDDQFNDINRIIRNMKTT